MGILPAGDNVPVDLDKREAGLGGDPTVVVAVSSHHDVTLLTPLFTPAEI